MPSAACPGIGHQSEIVPPASSTVLVRVAPGAIVPTLTVPCPPPARSSLCAILPALWTTSLTVPACTDFTERRMWYSLSVTLTVVAAAEPLAATVKVTESEYHIRLSAKSVRAGTVTLVVHNAGKIAHQLDLAGGGHGTVAVGTIAPGATRTKTVKLAGGTISLWCPIPGHAALGMRASLHVAGAAGAGSSGTTTSGTAWG